MFIVGNQCFRFLVQASQAFGRVVGAKNRSGRSCACQQHYCEFHRHGLIVLYRELCEYDSCLSWGEWIRDLRILGIDPGLTNTGYGLIEVDGQDYTVVEGGVVRTKSGVPMEQRLFMIYSAIRDVIQEFNPHAVAIEDLHSHARFVKTAILLGHARGVAVMAAGEADVPVFNYQPTRAKNIVTGSGRADKEQVKAAVSTHLRAPDVAKNEHVADAFSIAICHAIMAGSPAVEAIEAIE